MAKLIGGTTVEGLLTVDSNIETDEGDVILDSTNNTIELGVLPTGSGNGLDADLLDGNHASSFVDASGDTMNGQLSLNHSEKSHIRLENDVNGGETRFRFRGKNSNGSYLHADEGLYAEGGYWGIKIPYSNTSGSGYKFTVSQNGDVNATSGLLQEQGNRVATRKWAENTATVNDADTVDGEHASAFADSGHTHDGRYYTETESDSNFAASGHLHDSRYLLESGDTLSGALTLSDGSTAASQSWVNNNADVPNADYADTAGDADTLDGREFSEVAVEQSSASFTSTDTTTDINQGSWTKIPWDVQKNIDSPYTHDPVNSPTQITFDEAGTYQVYASLSYDTNSYRVNPGIKFAINGTRRKAMGLSGYIRDASGHSEGSNSLMETFSVSAGDTLTIQTHQYGSSGTCPMRSEESTLEISSITTRTASTTDADTLDGEHAAAFLKSTGGTLTGNLNASDSMTIGRGGSSMDSNNSIESTGSYLGLDTKSGATGGVLLGYYNAPEVRIGNGGIDINMNGSVYISEQLTIPEVTSDPADGNLWIRSDL